MMKDVLNFREVMSFEVDENGLPTLCQKNFAIIDLLISNDSNYRKSDNRDENYEKILKEGIPTKSEDIKKVVKLIDKQNSTHLSSEGQKYKGASNGREITAMKIQKLIESGELEKSLKNGDVEIIHKIANAVNEYHKENNNYLCSKYNFSFATKFCAYTSKFALNKDNYCIYDNVVSKVLPYYAKMYIDKKYWHNRNGKITSEFINRKGKEDYINYRQVIDEILASAKVKHGYKISYKEFDNLLWYYFKGEPSRLNKAYEALN